MIREDLKIIHRHKKALKDLNERTPLVTMIKNGEQLCRRFVTRFREALWEYPEHLRQFATYQREQGLKAGLTAEALAQLCGIATASIHTWTGSYSKGPTSAHMTALLDASGLQMGDLYTTEECELMDEIRERALEIRRGG